MVNLIFCLQLDFIFFVKVDDKFKVNKAPCRIVHLTDLQANTGFLLKIVDNDLFACNRYISI